MRNITICLIFVLGLAGMFCQAQGARLDESNAPTRETVNSSAMILAANTYNGAYSQDADVVNERISEARAHADSKSPEQKKSDNDEARTWILFGIVGLFLTVVIRFISSQHGFGIVNWVLVACSACAICFGIFKILF
jgi:Flp pilus assembly protein TadB